MSEKSAKAARKRAADARPDRAAKTYTLRPARGQALLNFQNRLRASTMPVFDAETLETAAPAQSLAAQAPAAPGWQNKIMQGDCLSACAWMKRSRIAADLVYIDPPFASGANYARKILLRQPDAKKSAKHGALQAGDAAVGEEVMYADIWQKEDYLNWIYERLLAIREVMAETASIYVHLDWHIGHYVKILMDEVFGEENFQNEIVWCYTGPTSPGLQRFNRKHDVIFWYTKSDSWTFNEAAMRVPHKDPKQKLRKAFDAGKGIGEEEVQKLRERGKLLEDYWFDVWSDIALAVRSPKERANYATQKPQKLVERIIEASSNKGDLVADFFCGSGTTARAAHALGRRFIVGDIGINAIQTTRDGLRKAGASFDILRIRDGVRLFRNPAQTEARLFSLVPGWRTRAELGLGEFWDGGIAGSDGEFKPVKFAGIQNLLTRQMLDVVLEEAAQLGDLGREAKSAVVLYAHKAEDVDQGYANRTAARHKRGGGGILLMSLDDLLASRGGVFHPEDSAEVSAKRTAKGWRVRVRAFYSPYLRAKLDAHNDARRAGKAAEKAPEPLRISEKGLELVECVQFDYGGDGPWRVGLEDCPKPPEMIVGEYEVRAKRFRMKIRSIAGDELVMSLDDILNPGPADSATVRSGSARKRKAPSRKIRKPRKKG